MYETQKRNRKFARVYNIAVYVHWRADKKAKKAKRKKTELSLVFRTTLLESCAAEDKAKYRRKDFSKDLRRFDIGVTVCNCRVTI